MSPPRLVSMALLAAAIGVGTFADRPRGRPPLTIGGYRVLAVDFHTHSSMWSDGTLTSWGMVLEARRQGLDAIAITGHNAVGEGKRGRWFSRLVGGPTVLVGEEITRELGDAPYHVIGVGIEETVSSRLGAANAIDDIHRQGGIAIAAHPGPDFWPGFDAAAMQRLDGAEICHPMIYALDEGQRDLERFAARGSVAAIGSSDFHGIGPMGLCRTFVFARDNTVPDILEAVRVHRTVVYGQNGRVYGDPMLLDLVAGDDRLREAAKGSAHGGTLDWLGGLAGLAGLAGVLALRRNASPKAA
jgi:hypothetical protein